MRVIVLGSGSAGNVLFVESGEPGVTPTRLLVDAGLNKGELEARLAAAGLRPPASDADAPKRRRRGRLGHIDALVVTHEHDDHIGCAASLPAPRYMTAGTRRVTGLDASDIRGGVAFRVGALEVMPVALPHDAVEPIGLRISDGSASIGLVTDLGHDSDAVAEAFTGCDVLILEANHDAALLDRGPYPPSVKRRIGGPRGHLSNAQSASLLARIARLGKAPRVVIAAHLSSANNHPTLVRRALADALPSRCRLLVAHQAWGAPEVRVAAGAITVEPIHFRQLALPLTGMFTAAETRP